MSATSVRPFDPEVHLDSLVRILRDVRHANVDYPPRQDADDSSHALADWVESETNPLGRWVAFVDDEVVGFVQITTPHDYLLEHLAGWSYSSLATDGFAEIGKLFVDPASQHNGVGALLLSTACAAAWALRLQPGLAVVVTSTAAMSLYRSEGMRLVGEFHGIHGVNQVWVDEQS